MAENELNIIKAENSEPVTEKPMGEIRVSVRNLVEFILRSGDIDNRFQSAPEAAMREGGRIHRMIQKSMGPGYRSEVTLSFCYPTKRYYLLIEGRADGIVDTPKEVMIDEIKGTYRDIWKLRKPVEVHLAQAKCYAYFYCLEHAHDSIKVRVTYCNIDTEEIRYFITEYSFEELKSWFEELMREYRRWADMEYEWNETRQKSLEGLEFPFPYREGQRELVTNVYQTIYHGRKLFLEAPTGVGKTISTVFPSLKAMSRGLANKVFYLTAKTITRTVADQTFELLRGDGLRFKSIVLTAKEKICFLEKPSCNPVDCPYAKGHYDRINDAVFDLITHEERFTRECIEQYARKYMVCPFEFALDVSLFADGVICDYNYLFDPHVYLKRFFSEGNRGDYIFLVDEAHNLLERGRDMYSAALIKEEMVALKNQLAAEIQSQMKEAKKKQKELDDTEEDGQLTLALTGVSTHVSTKKKAKKKRNLGTSILVSKGYAQTLIYHLDNCLKELVPIQKECVNYIKLPEIENLVKPLIRLYSSLSDYMEEREEEKLPIREVLLDFYFKVAHFMDMYERLDANYVIYAQQEENSFFIKLFCVNPRENLKECMLRGRSTILFSATLLPIQYYKELLGGEKSDYEVYAKSVFESEKRALFIAKDVTSKYVRRTKEEFDRMAYYIAQVTSQRTGNYMVFCPSYSFMRTLYEAFEEAYLQESTECILQSETMTEEEREYFLSRFTGNEDCSFDEIITMDIETEEEKTLIGFCVLGGIFGEGIDLKKDTLIGVMIVGTGLPLVCSEREILKEYFDKRGENGFDYAYRYPGINKVLQAAGRVIRTAEDVGVIALLDERFLQPSYQRLFPREWDCLDATKAEEIAAKVERFWDSWGKYS